MVGVLTALPLRVAEFQVSAGASWVFAGALGAAEALDLVVEGLECGIHLGIMLSQVASCLIGPHVLQGVGALLSLAKASKGGHVNARAGGARRARGSRVSRRTLQQGTEKSARNDRDATLPVSIPTF